MVAVQVVGHMTHIEESDWIDRTKVILEHGTDRPFDPVDREAGFARFKGWSIDAAARSVRGGARRRTSRSWTSWSPPGDLDRRGLHPSFGEVTLGQLLATWVVHDLNHTGQIVKAMAKQYRDAIGPWREFLPIVDAP